jgi:hypothetical protein
MPELYPQNLKIIILVKVSPPKKACNIDKEMKMKINKIFSRHKPKL